MNKFILTAVVISGFLLFGTLLHFGYMNFTSYECQIDLPPKPFIDENGQEYYVGDSSFQEKIKCSGGFLADFPIN